MDKLSKDQVLRANVDLHTALSATYNQDEPHFRPENVKYVRGCVERLKSQTGAESLLDIGCGTGFMIGIARELGFKKIMGLDITPSMIERIDRHPSVEVQIADVTEPFPVKPSAFGMVTAYTFLSHLYTLETTFKEVYKCLKPGGAFYSDLDPNYYFWEALSGLDDTIAHQPFIQREILHTKNNDRQIEQKYGVSAATYNMAEFQKAKTGGMKEENIERLLRQAGFSKIVFRYYWFVGQAVINNDGSIGLVRRDQLIQDVDSYLQGMLPISRNLYKYISFIAYK